MPLSRPPRLRLRNEDGRELAALVWSFDMPVLMVSSAAIGGGLGERRWVFNAQVAHGYGRTDLDEHAHELTQQFGLDGLGVGMFTAVDVRHASAAEQDGVHLVATVGVTDPAWAADPGARRLALRPGTINLVAQLPLRLSDGGLVNLVSTAAEAKAQALAERGLPGTGTPSDAVTVVCPVDGPVEPFGGPRSTWGARLAQATHRAIHAALDAGAPT